MQLFSKCNDHEIIYIFTDQWSSVCVQISLYLTLTPAPGLSESTSPGSEAQESSFSHILPRDMCVCVCVCIYIYICIFFFFASILSPWELTHSTKDKLCTSPWLGYYYKISKIPSSPEMQETECHRSKEVSQIGSNASPSNSNLYNWDKLCNLFIFLTWIMEMIPHHTFILGLDLAHATCLK